MGVKNNRPFVFSIFEDHSSSIAFPPSTLISWLANQGLYMCEPLGRQSAIEDNTQLAIAVKNRLLYQAGWSVKRDIASNSDVSGFQLCSEKAIALSCYIEVTSGGQHSREPGHQDTVLRRERTSNCSSHQVRAPVENYLSKRTFPTAGVTSKCIDSLG